MSGGVNNSRPTSMTDPTGRVTNYGYGRGLSNAVSRLDVVSDGGGTCFVVSGASVTAAAQDLCSTAFG